MELSKRLFKLFQVHFSIFNLLRTTDTLLILKYKNGLNHVFYKNKDVFMSLPGLLLFSMPNNLIYIWFIHIHMCGLGSYKD